ncbi:MAG: vWA domain-containing protein, partial [Gemmataceae bacterium]
LTYKAKDGKTTFAWQVKPQLAAAPDRDRDILVLVDTSASQAGNPLQRARQIIDGLAASAAVNDRINIWTVNVNDEAATRSLTRGFQPGKSPAVLSASASLVETEYASGATDLANGITKALATIEPNQARQQIILFLGDGESAASTTPLNETVRNEIGSKMELQNVAFFAVPLGVKLNPTNLHGFASLTGGAVVRATDDVLTLQGRNDFTAKLKSSFAVPVLRADQVKFGPEVATAFPTRLPPMRADRPTLIVGTLTGETASISATITGKTVTGAPQTLTVAERLPGSDAENYFLHAMLEQWKTSTTPDAPAILAADRALALASQQFRLFREEFLTNAVYAVSNSRFDHAEKLYEAALKIDPSNTEANSGIAVVQKMKSGALSHDKLRAELQNADKYRASLVAGKLGKISTQEAAKPAAPPAAGTPPTADNALRQAQAERQVQEQQFRVLVDDTIRRARQILNTDPDTAYDDLKRQREIVLSNAALGDSFRSKLAADLEGMMQTVSSQGAAIKKAAAAERERIARTRLRISEYERQQTQEEQTRSRIDAFKQLMSQARYELAQQEAQIMIQERVARGQTVPPEATASYLIGQAATNLREHRELVRLREDRFLLT